jgi:Domain of unknown function (DUF4440)
MKNKWMYWIIPFAVATTPFAIERTSASPSGTQSAVALADQLLSVEKQFWESWKHGKPEVFQELMTDDAIFFGQYGVSSKAEIVQQQKESVGSCQVESYALTDPRVIRIDDEAAILLYEARQDATCGGVKVQPIMHGSSVFARRAGKWLNLYRSEVPPAQ